VRAGAILPIAPVVQSTNEIPRGPLTLRVYAGDACAGHLYLDDGTTYAYLRGESLNIDFRCETTPDRLRLFLGEHKGSYPAWWKEIRVEIYGWSSQRNSARLDGTEINAPIEVSADRIALNVTDNGKGAVLEIQ
jgi:alpha-glucosidase